MNYYPFHIADWALHTSHLSVEEEGVYRRLIDHYYDTELPIPRKTQPVIRRLRLVSYEDTVRQILSEFFIPEEDGWHNLRADIEIKGYHGKAETARRNGKKGGRPKKNRGVKTQSVVLANPDHNLNEPSRKLTNNQEPITNNQEPNKDQNNRRFSPPSIPEVQSHCDLKNYSFDVEHFFAHHEARGWVLSNGKKMKCWKSAATTWNKNQEKFNGNSKGNFNAPHDSRRLSGAERTRLAREQQRQREENRRDTV